MSERNVKIFDVPGEYSWTVPNGVERIWVSAAGAGAGGAGGGLNRILSSDNETCTGAGGGGGASIRLKPFAVSPQSALQISVGRGGNGGKVGNHNTVGGNGAISVLLKGGNAPKAHTHQDSNAFYNGGLPGGEGGQRGGDGFLLNMMAEESPNLTTGGKGGDTLLGFGGCGGSSRTWESVRTGESGVCGGGGGGGGAGYPSHNMYGAGGKGGDGIVVIEW